MEETKFRLDHYDASIVANICEKLYSDILTKLQQKEEKIQELDLLWQTLKSTDKPLTASSCAKLITRLTFSSDGFLKPKEILGSFFTAASISKFPEGICWSIGQILWKSEVHNEYGIARNQHPFVALLRSSPQRNWPHVAAQLQNDFKNDPIKALNLHKSVYIFVFCDPNAHAHFSALRSILMRDLLEIKNELLDHIVKWLPLENCSNQVFQELISLVVMPWIGTFDWKNQLAIPYLCSLLLQHVERGLDPRLIISAIRKSPGDIDNLSIILLSQVLDKCTFDHMESILTIVEEKSINVHPLALGVLVLSLFQILTQASKLMPGILSIGSEIIHRFYKAESFSDETVKFNVPEVFMFDQNIARACQFNEKVVSNSQFLFKIAGSKLLAYNDPKSMNMSLDSIKQIITDDKSLSPRALTLLLHKMTMLEKSKANHKDIIKKIIFMVPDLAKDKTCIASILAFISR